MAHFSMCISQKACSSKIMAMWPRLTYYYCNTPGVCHQLSNGFELKHDMLSGYEGVKIRSIRVSSNLNLDNAPLLTCVPLLRLCKSNVQHAYFMYITSTCIHLDQWKSFMKFGIRSHTKYEMSTKP